MEDTVYYLAREHGRDANYSRLYAVAADDGTERWSRAVRGLTTDTIAAGNGRVVVVTDARVDSDSPEYDYREQTRATAFDAGTGSREWQWTRKVHAQTGVTVAGDVVLLVAGNALVALDASDGSSHWTLPMDAPNDLGADRPPSVAGDAAFVSFGGTLRAVGKT